MKRAQRHLRFYRQRLNAHRKTAVGVVDQPFICTPMVYGPDRSEVYLPMDWLKHENAFMVRKDVLAQCRYLIDLAREAAALFPSPSVLAVMQQVRSEVLQVFLKSEDKRKILRENVLHLSIDAFMIVAAWHKELKTPGSCERFRECLERVLKTLEVPVSQFRWDMLDLQASMSRSSQKDQLICNTIWEKSSVLFFAKLNAIRGNNPEAVKAVLSQVARLPVRTDCLRSLIQEIVKSAAHAVEAVGFDKIKGEFGGTEPLMSRTSMAMIGSFTKMKGIDYFSLDKGNESRFVRLSKEAGKIAAQINPPANFLSEKQVLEVPVFFTGSRPAALLPLKRLNLTKTLTATLNNGYPTLCKKSITLAKWQIPLDTPPAKSITGNNAGTQLPALVVCIDTSRSTRTSLAGTPYTVMSACQIASLSILMLLENFKHKGVPTPDFISVNFSSNTIISRQDDAHLAGLNICLEQEGNTTLDVPEILRAVAKKMELVVVTDGELDNKATTVQALQHPDIEGISLFEIRPDTGTNLSEFAREVCGNHPQGRAFRISLADETTLVTAFHHLIRSIYHLPADMYQEGPENQAGGKLVMEC